MLVEMEDEFVAAAAEAGSENGIVDGNRRGEIVESRENV